LAGWRPKAGDRSLEERIQNARLLPPACQMSLKCNGFARDSAKVADQVRVLAKTLRIIAASSLQSPVSSLQPATARECDGFARLSSKQLDKVRFLGELLERVSGFRRQVS
jgi:hypothetical protein